MGAVLRVILVIGAFWGTIFGVGTLRERQEAHAEHRCHCKCLVVSGDWPQAQEVVPKLLEPTESVGAYQAWGGGILVCLSPDERHPQQRWRVLQYRTDEAVAQAERKGRP